MLFPKDGQNKTGGIQYGTSGFLNSAGINVDLLCH